MVATLPMSNPNEVVSGADIVRCILTVRDHRVILDSDLARIYGVETRSLNQAVKRNENRFPEDFMFQLTDAEAEEALRLRSQIVILKPGRDSTVNTLPTPLLSTAP